MPKCPFCLFLSFFANLLLFALCVWVCGCPGQQQRRASWMLCAMVTTTGALPPPTGSPVIPVNGVYERKTAQGQHSISCVHSLRMDRFNVYDMTRLDFYLLPQLLCRTSHQLSYGACFSCHLSIYIHVCRIPNVLAHSHSDSGSDNQPTAAPDSYNVDAEPHPVHTPAGANNQAAASSLDTGADARLVAYDSLSAITASGQQHHPECVGGCEGGVCVLDKQRSGSGSSPGGGCCHVAPHPYRRQYFPVNHFYCG